MTLMPKIKTLRGSMEATRTWIQRWWLWIETPSMPIDGFLLLGQIAAKSYQLDEQTYGLLEVRSAFPGFRAFALRKCGATLGGDDEQYTVSIGPRSSQCTCKAGRTRNEVCRHRDGIKAAILSGALPKRDLQGA